MRWATAAALASTLCLFGCPSRREPPAPEPDREIVRGADYEEGPCIAGDSEPWPVKGYQEPAGESPFGVFAHAGRFKLEWVGAALILHAWPRLYLIEHGKLHGLPNLPKLFAGRRWQIERLAGSPANLMVEVDEPRHATMPSDARVRFWRDGATWGAAIPVGEAQRKRPVYRALTFADGRVFEVREDDLLTLGVGPDAPSTPASLDFGAAPAGCKHAYRYLDQAFVRDGVTYVTGRSCADPPREFVTHFDAGGTPSRAAPLSVAPFELFFPKYAVAPGGGFFVAGDCAGGDEKEGPRPCYATIGPRGWERLEGPREITPSAVAVAGDGTLWVAAYVAGDFSGRAWNPRVPAPVGEVLKKSPGGAWERVPLPREPIIDGWEQRRFVAESVVADADDVYVGGFFFYTHKTAAADRVQTKRRYALLRLGAKGKAMELGAPP